MNAYLQIGIIMAKAGDHDEAMKYFDTVLEAEPRNAAALNNKANLHMLDGQYPSAQKLYLTASQADPRDAEVLVNLAKAYMAGKKVKEAKAAFGHARKLDPAVADRHKALALELQGTLSPAKKHRTTRRKDKS
jgi:tetratricopeptide (TPR) repeat protein